MCVQPAIAPNNVLADAQASKHAAKQAAAAGADADASGGSVGDPAGANSVPVTDLSAAPASPLPNGASAAALQPAEGTAVGGTAAAAVAAIEDLVEQYGGEPAKQEVWDANASSGECHMTAGVPDLVQSNLQGLNSGTLRSLPAVSVLY